MFALGALKSRNRSIHQYKAMMAKIHIPNVYVFNVGKRPWTGVGGGRTWTIPACPEGQMYSKPIAIPMIVPSERDLADGNGSMDVIPNPALTEIQDVNGFEQQVTGVVDDLIGKSSTSPQLSLYTTNGEWFGVFYSMSEVPKDEEVLAAEDKLRQMQDLIYATGAQMVEQGQEVKATDRLLYNEAASYLGRPFLWGNRDHRLTQCPECGEDVRQGAKVCKHCQLPIDAASVAARDKKRQREAEKMLKGEEQVN